jgi:hypothetical protein
LGLAVAAAAREALDVGAKVLEFNMLLASAQAPLETRCLLPARLLLVQNDLRLLQELVLETLCHLFGKRLSVSRCRELLGHLVSDGSQRFCMMLVLYFVPGRLFPVYSGHLIIEQRYR